jgi:hypothetical protein
VVDKHRRPGPIHRAGGARWGSYRRHVERRVRRNPRQAAVRVATRRRAVILYLHGSTAPLARTRRARSTAT